MLITTHDARGNLTSDPTAGKTYGYWPSTNQLRSVGSPFASLSYDALDRLATIDSTADTNFAYDGFDMIVEYAPNGAVQARYVHGPGMDQPLVRYDGAGTGNKQSLHSDERGSIIALTYGSPYAPTINRYDEFGKPQSTNVGRFQYTGQTWLPEAGVYHYKNRAYAAHLGRFLQTDPLGYEDTPNLYAYVGNDPVNLTDPLGLAGCGPGEVRFVHPSSTPPYYYPGGAAITAPYSFSCGTIDYSSYSSSSEDSSYRGGDGGGGGGSRGPEPSRLKQCEIQWLNKVLSKSGPSNGRFAGHKVHLRCRSVWFPDCSANGHSLRASKHPGGYPRERGVR